jgi:hypothetical protein
MSTIFDARLDYIAGGVTWTFNAPYSKPPIISIGIQLKSGGLADSIYPLSHKIVGLTSSSVTVKVYKVISTDITDLLFSECATNDVIVHIMAEGE